MIRRDRRKKEKKTEESHAEAQRPQRKKGGWEKLTQAQIRDVECTGFCTARRLIIPTTRRE